MMVFLPRSPKPNIVPGVVPWFTNAPLRGQGSFAFNSAGGREDSANYIVGWKVI
jgi:hypothetical protein